MPPTTSPIITTCTRRLQFCAGHRVMGHESKCAHLHGHNYVAEITAHAIFGNSPLDSLGRVVDFSVLKERVGCWIEANWDHGFILKSIDRSGLNAIAAFDDTMRQTLPDFTQKLFLLDENPTAENMAAYLLTVVCPAVLEGTGVRAVKVVLHETENCKAEVTIP